MTFRSIGIEPEVIVFQRIVTASLVSLALAGCTALSMSPAQRANTANQTPHAIYAESEFTGQQSTIILQWIPTSVKLTDGGPYQVTSLTYIHGFTVVVNYDRSCDYRVDYDLHPGPIKHNVETDGYNFYAYSGKSGSPPFHCNVIALLKNANGQVIARSALALTITYPRKHGHGG